MTTPCTPSPCGANAICKEQNGAGSCTCLPDYFGNPYEGCRPECILNSDCPSFLSCVQNKCKDPCPGACAPNTDCAAINHMPSCTCRTGYTGNPFSFCSVITQARKSTIDLYIVLLHLALLQISHDLRSGYFIRLAWFERFLKTHELPATYIRLPYVK